VRSVSFIGYGEFADAIGRGLAATGIDVCAYGRSRADPSAAQARSDRMDAAGVRPAESLSAALTNADVVIAAVPASSAGEVVKACAPHLHSGQIYVDPSPSLPATKRTAAELVAHAGAEYVDVAVLGTVVTAGASVPMLASGSGAERLSAEASAAGLNVTAIAGAAGDAALVKLLRSVFMKGRDALVLEMLLAARRHGVEEAVLASIGGAGEQVPFPSLAERVMCSLVVYAERRADELADAAALLCDVGVEPMMAQAGEKRLRQLADSGLSARFGGQRPHDLAEVLNALDALEKEQGADVASVH
jgi:3-hydroxyisobutyrate dehydrogenase-like beta-hydroxyacid dehydrogenase